MKLIQNLRKRTTQFMRVILFHKRLSILHYYLLRIYAIVYYNFKRNECISNGLVKILVLVILDNIIK